MNYVKITTTDNENKEKKIKNLNDFLIFKGLNISDINNKTKKVKKT
jgi:hypothetical protein